MEREYDDFLIGPQSDEFIPDHFERDSDILDEFDDDASWDDDDDDGLDDREAEEEEEELEEDDDEMWD